MKTIFAFVRTTLTGGILFLLPIVLLIAVINKANDMLLRVSEPIAKRLPDLILGFDGSKLIALILLIVFCFISGLLFRSPRVRRLITSLEVSVLSYLPGYSMLKSITADAVGEKSENKLMTVLVADGDGWKIGFLSEETPDFCTVYIPDAPRHDSGDVLILPTSQVKKMDVPSHVAVKCIKNFGKGAMQWMNKS